ncbi:kinase-like protein, partial [Amniculicola lignicola CBS 123094]
RQDWAAIRAISDEAFVSVVSLYVDQTGLVRKCQLLRYEEGGFHRVAFVRITDDGVSQEYVVKVPATGTSRSWTDGDAHSLMCEAELMRLVHSRTTVPVPELIFYDTDLYNHLGAPFILMRAVTGKPAYTFWYDGWEDRDDLWKTAESPSPKAEKFRVNFLRSLAAVMAQLSTLTFDRIGMPSWDENGMSACAVDQFESFTLLHNDIDLQNLLVDEDGNITGVLDWDGTIAAPRSIAAAAAPVFLRQDWYPEFNPLEDQPWLCMSLPRYRRIYADALKEFGCSDAKYTEKSPIYQAMKAALSQGGDAEDLIGKLLLQIPEIQRMDVKIVAEAVGKGSPALEELLKDRLPLLLLPEEERKPMASKL